MKRQELIVGARTRTVGRQWFLRSSLITSLPDEVINKTVLEFADTPIGCSECRSNS